MQAAEPKKANVPNQSAAQYGAEQTGESSDMSVAMIHDSPRQAAQRKAMDRIQHAPHVLAQRKSIARIQNSSLSQTQGRVPDSQTSESADAMDVEAVAKNEFAHVMQGKADVSAWQSVRQNVESDIAAGKFIVDDQAIPAAGQMTKTDFLSALRAKVRQLAGQILAQIGQDADDCPYIHYWFEYYASKDIVHIEEALARYAPEAMSAASSENCIDIVAQHVGAAFSQHVATGSMEGVPEGMPEDLHEQEAPKEEKPKQGSEAPIQMCGSTPAADDFETGSASKNKRLAKFQKNQHWEIGFRKLSKVKPGEFNPARENDAIIPLQTVHIEQGIPINHSIEGIAISRNPDFVSDVLRMGNQKVVVIVAIPPDFGIDLEAEYLKHVANTEGGRPPEYVKGEASKLSMEVTLQRVPTGCIYGWYERNNGKIKYVDNPARACPNIDDVDPGGRVARLRAIVRSIQAEEAT